MDILFKEKQRFSQWWIVLLMLSINGLFLYAIFQQVILGVQFGNHPMNDSGLLIATTLVLLFSFLFFQIRLETVIKTDGIYVRFFPFQLAFKHYKREQLLKAYVREYNALKEYGGWGMRIGIFGKGQAFNISGNMGLQLEFNNNDKLLIGTNKPEELTEALIKSGQLKY